MPLLVNFLNQYRAKTTRAMYLSAWVKFLSLLYGARLKGASPEILDPWVAKYVNDLRNGRRDLAADLQALGENCRTRKTCLGYQSAIRALLAGEDLSLSPGGQRHLRRARAPHPLTPRDEPLTSGRILKIMEHLDTRGRAILYILISSGARLGEVLSIDLGDLDLDSRPARFRIRIEEKRRVPGGVHLPGGGGGDPGLPYREGPVRGLCPVEGRDGGRGAPLSPRHPCLRADLGTGSLEGEAGEVRPGHEQADHHPPCDPAVLRRAG